jgi:hypothetical protein
MIKNIKFLGREVKSDISVLTYSGSLNQSSSLKPIINGLKKLGIFSLNVDNNIQDNEQFEKVSFKISDVLLCLYFLWERRGFRRKIINEHKYGELILSKYYSGVLSVYIYLPYFLRILEENKPKYTITANDHNVENRALRLASEVLGIKSVYVQHASVTKYFPPLNFDLAFLDGYNSLKTYRQCESVDKTLKNRNCTVFLTGQQKDIPRNRSKYNRDSIGIALSVTDELAYVEEFITKLASLDISIHIRPHPRQSNKTVDRLRSLKYNFSNLHISDPKAQSQRSFFNNISLLIAGDTSTHLEASLFGINSYYKKFNDSITNPHYDFLDTGLIENLPDYFYSTPSYSELKSLLRKRNIDRVLKTYSQSYNTKWHNKEGDAVAMTLVDIFEEKVNYKKDNTFIGFNKVYYLCD